ncbi:hypothetical protein SD81_001045 [Tolypothrix campylonemoides VB511288]|nr:hypothetical protein SD81_001045 [Tolypothrix campylonemoides VB511288]
MLTNPHRNFYRRSLVYSQKIALVATAPPFHKRTGELSFKRLGSSIPYTGVALKDSTFLPSWDTESGEGDTSPMQRAYYLIAATTRIKAMTLRAC